MSRANGPPISVGNEVVQLVRVYADDLRENLPRPGRSWEWTACELDPSLQQRLVSHDLIVRDDDTERWETTEQFWSYVLYRLGASDDGIGTDLGQESLFAPIAVPEPRKDRVDTKVQARSGPSTEQVTLTGDPVKVSDDPTGTVERNATKGPDSNRDPTKPPPRTLPLVFYVGGTWTDIGPSTGGSLERPLGTVY